MNEDKNNDPIDPKILEHDREEGLRMEQRRMRYEVLIACIVVALFIYFMCR